MEREEWKRGEGSTDVMKPWPVARQASDLSPLQKLLQHLAGLHYATIPCSFLSDIKGWCEFYWTPKPRANVLPSIWPIAENSRRRRMWKCTMRWGGDDVLHQSVSQQTLSQPSDCWLQGCFAFFTMYRCWGGGGSGRRGEEGLWCHGPGLHARPDGVMGTASCGLNYNAQWWGRLVLFFFWDTRLNLCVESSVFRRDEGNRRNFFAFFFAGGRREPCLP